MSKPITHVEVSQPGEQPRKVEIPASRVTTIVLPRETVDRIKRMQERSEPCRKSSK